MRFMVLMMALFAMLMGANLKWSSDYDAALKEAKKEKKDVYLFLGSEYCKYCEKVLRKRFLVRKDVEAKTQKKVCFALSIQRHRRHTPHILKPNQYQDTTF